MINKIQFIFRCLVSCLFFKLVERTRPWVQLVHSLLLYLVQFQFAAAKCTISVLLPVGIYSSPNLLAAGPVVYLEAITEFRVFLDSVPL